MNIYVSHSSGYDYATELYKPLKDTLAHEHTVYFPHDPGNDGSKSKEILLQSDVLLAEVSYPSTGQGIELGWADDSHMTIIVFYRSDATPSSSIAHIASKSFAYGTTEQMVERLTEAILSLK